MKPEPCPECGQSVVVIDGKLWTPMGECKDIMLNNENRVGSASVFLGHSPSTCLDYKRARARARVGLT